MHCGEKILSQTGDQRDVSRDLIIVHHKTANHILIDVGAVCAYTGDLRQSRAGRRHTGKQVNQGSIKTVVR